MKFVPAPSAIPEFSPEIAELVLFTVGVPVLLALFLGMRLSAIGTSSLVVAAAAILAG